MGRWRVQDAQARFEELVRSAAQDGPQEIAIDGEPALVLLSKLEYERLQVRKPRFTELMRGSELVGVDLD